MPKPSRIRQVIEGDAMDAASVRQGMRNHSCAINAAGHAKDGHHFHLLFKGTRSEASSAGCPEHIPSSKGAEKIPI